jgi:hypothetical protein
VTEVPVVQLKGLVKAETVFQPLGYLGIYLFILVGGAITCNNHLEKYESQWKGLSHILWGKICLKPPTSKSESKALYIASKCPSVGKC